jgi:hypothetical protein
MTRRLPQPRVEIDDGCYRFVGSVERAEPNRAQGPDNLCPVHRDELAQRVGVERLLDRAQERVVHQHLAKLPHAAPEKAARHLIGRRLPEAGTIRSQIGPALASREFRSRFDLGRPEAKHHFGTGRKWRRGVLAIFVGVPNCHEPSPSSWPPLTTFAAPRHSEARERTLAEIRVEGGASFVYSNAFSRTLVDFGGR